MKILIFSILAVVATSAFEFSPEETEDILDICVLSFENQKCSCSAIDNYHVAVSADCIPESSKRASVKFSRNSGYFSVITVEKIFFPDELWGTPVKDLALVKLSNPLNIEKDIREESLLNSNTLSGAEAYEYLRKNLPDEKYRTCGTEGDFVKCHDLILIDSTDAFEGKYEPSERSIGFQTSDGKKLSVEDYGGPVYATASRIKIKIKIKITIDGDIEITISISW